MLSWTRPIPCVFLLCLVPSGFAQEGRLSQIREEVRQPETRGNEGSLLAPHDSDEDTSPFGWFLSALFTPDPDAETNPEIRPCSAPYYSPRYPYRRGYPGFLTVHANSQPEVAEYWQAAPMKVWWGTLALEGGSDLDNLYRLGLRARLDSTCRLGLSTSWDHYHENLGRGRSDDFNVGDANATIRFWECHWGQAHAGLGFRWLSDEHAADFGFNFQASADFFPARPLVVSLLADLGRVGDASVFHIRATLGLVHKNWEIFGGVDHLSIGRVDLQGPLLGLRVWF